MNRIRGFHSAWWIQGLGYFSLAILIWLAGPALATAFESTNNRLAAIASLVVLWLATPLLQRLFAANQDRRLLRSLVKTSPVSPYPPQPASEEFASLQKGFVEALQFLKESRGKHHKNPQFLYELPWYVIIGAPGSGKSTALENCGLRFPLRERFGKSAVRGIGGTRNCDWWFSQTAVLLDTAGRYTTQDSHPAMDAAAWKDFLQLLKSYRPRRPLDGILVALSFTDLLQQGEAERARQALAIQQRIQELQATLGVHLPVYMLFTKADLIAGFADFFADLNEDERAQVWGETFSAEKSIHPKECLAQFQGSFEELLARLNRRSFKRLQEEHDISRRSQILEFPQQLALLKPQILDFLYRAFAGHPYESPPLFRGVYFSSGTQEGTPIDRVMGHLLQVFNFKGIPLQHYSGRGKSFFLHDLMQAVIIAEAGILGLNPRLERRQKWMRYLSLSLIAGLSLASVSLWGLSYFSNQAYLHRSDERIQYFRALDATQLDTPRYFKLLSEKLDALQAINQLWSTANWRFHFGLYQGEKIKADVDDVYEQIAIEYLLPGLVNRLQVRLQGDEASKLETLQPLLEAYLMLGEPEKMAVKPLTHVVETDWEQMFATEPATLASLKLHLQYLLALKLPGTQLDAKVKSTACTQLSMLSDGKFCQQLRAN